MSLVAPGTVLMAGAVAKRRKSRRDSQVASSSRRAEKTVGARAAVVMRAEEPRKNGRGAAEVAAEMRNGKNGKNGKTEEPLDLGLGPELVVKVPPYDRRKVGVLLLNIGTPASTEVGDVRDYLEKFLADDRVIEIEPPFLKWLVLQFLLLVRPKSSAVNYRKIWDPVRGSPLLFHSLDLAKGLQEEMGDRFEVRIGMQYSSPTVDESLKDLAESGVDSVVLIPMFPHYASGTTGSCLAGAYRTAAELYCTPFLSVLPPFYGHRLYVAAMKKRISETIGERGKNVDHILFSFHGVPEEQCSRTDATKSFCNKSASCCSMLQKENRNCYRAQCFETARLLAYELGLEDGRWSIGFQSRLTLRGTIEWIKPYTDEGFVELAKKGVKKLAVVAPSFTADCVETLEELGITGREDFEAAGGEELVVIPCLNSSEHWVKNLAQIVREHIAETARDPIDAIQTSRARQPGFEEMEEDSLQTAAQSNFQQAARG